MTIASEISRLTGLRNRIRTRIINLGLDNDPLIDLDDCTGIIENMSCHLVTKGFFEADNQLSVTLPIQNAGYMLSVQVILYDWTSQPSGDTLAFGFKDFAHAMYFMRTDHTRLSGIAGNVVTPTSSSFVINLTNHNAKFNGTYQYVIITSPTQI